MCGHGKSDFRVRKPTTRQRLCCACSESSAHFPCKPSWNYPLQPASHKIHLSFHHVYLLISIIFNYTFLQMTKTLCTLITNRVKELGYNRCSNKHQFMVWCLGICGCLPLMLVCTSVLKPACYKPLPQSKQHPSFLTFTSHRYKIVTYVSLCQRAEQGMRVVSLAKKCRNVGGGFIFPRKKFFLLHVLKLSPPPPSPPLPSPSLPPTQINTTLHILLYFQLTG